MQGREDEKMGMKERREWSERVEYTTETCSGSPASAPHDPLPPTAARHRHRS